MVAAGFSLRVEIRELTQPEGCGYQKLGLCLEFI